jgi:hypothetical protein
MMGTDCPGDMLNSDPVKTVASVPHLLDTERDMIYGNNARSRFKI